MLPKVPFRDESHVCSPSIDEGDHLRILWKRLEPSSISITRDTYNHILPNHQKGAKPRRILIHRTSLHTPTLRWLVRRAWCPFTVGKGKGGVSTRIML